MTRISRASLGIVVAVILLFAWLLYVRQPVQPQPSAGESPAAPSRGGQLTTTYRREPPTFNRYVGAGANAATELVARLTGDGLVRINRVTGELEPRLAESWAASDDRLTYTLKLRAGVKFSDGAPFTSVDVLFSFDAAYNGDGSTLGDAVKVGGKPLEVSAPDDLTVVIRFPAAFGPGLRLLDGLPILPKHKLDAAVRETRFAGAWGSTTPPGEMAGLGPFMLTEYSPGQRVVFARNPNFWRQDAAGVQLPYLDRIVIDIVTDQNAEALRLQAGQADLITSEARPEDIAPFRRDAQAGRLQLVEVGVGVDPNQLWFNLVAGAKAKDPRRSWLQSEGLRKAISHAVDRDAFVNAVYLGAGVPIWGPITPGNHIWYTPDVPTYPQDVTRARELLGQVGLADRNGDGLLEDRTSAPARFAIITQQGHTLRERSVAVIQEQLRKVGLTIDVVTLDTGGLFGRYAKGDYDAIFFGVESNDFEPSALREFWLSSGQFHFWNPMQPKPATEWEARIDDLMTRQEAMDDLSARTRLFADAQRLLAEHAPALYFASPTIFVAMSPRVVGATPALFNPQVLWNAEALGVRQSAAR